MTLTIRTSIQHNIWACPNDGDRLCGQVGSYNVNGRMPDSDLDLKPWIDAAGSGADIVAVAFQEIVPLNAQNVVIGECLHHGIIAYSSGGISLALGVMASPI